MRNSKLIGHLVLSVLAAFFLSCERPEIKKRSDAPAPISPVETENEKQRKRYSDTSLDISDSKYAIDVRDLVSNKSVEFHAMITDRTALDLVTSKSWTTSSFHAVNGLLTGEGKAKAMRSAVRCHFVNFKQDFENIDKQSEYTLSEVNLYQWPFRNYVLHLTHPKDKTSKYIACAVPADQSLTGGDLVKAFGDELGLWVYLK